MGGVPVLNVVAGPAVVNGATTDLWLPDTGNYRLLRVPLD